MISKVLRSVLTIDYILTMSITLEIPAAVAESVNLTPREALIDVAIGIYKREKLSFSACAKMVGMSHLEFQNELGKRQIPLNIDAEDVEQDVNTLKDFLKEV